MATGTRARSRGLAAVCRSGWDRVILAGAGRRLHVIGESVTLKVTQADTDGACTMAELVLQPGGGPPPHTHRSTELFLIHEGELEFTRMVDGVPETFRATAGDSVFIPGDAVHTYHTVSDTPARVGTLPAPAPIAGALRITIEGRFR